MAGETTFTILPARKITGGIECAVDIDGDVRHVQFCGAEVSSTSAADAGLAVALMPAMRAGRLLRTSEPTSRRLLAAIPTIQDIFCNWEQRFPIYGRYRHVEVEAGPGASVRRKSGRGTAAFFSGGADSFYTALRHRDEIDALILVHGFDFSAEEGGDLSLRIADGVRSAAAALGKPLVEVRTDVRTFSDSFVHWEGYHGAAMASVAHLLATRFSKVFIPATLTYAHLMPLGSHPLLDPLWSTEAVELIHDGCEASRLEKLAYVADEAAARQWLRVCWENRDARYNCGTCEKCLRTMVALQALGLRERFTAFPDAIDTVALSRVEMPDLQYTWEASLRVLHQSGSDPELEKVLHHRLHNSRARMEIRARRYARRARSWARARGGA